MSEVREGQAAQEAAAELIEEEAPDVVEALPAETDGQAVDPGALGLELPEDRDETKQLLLTEIVKAREEASSYLDDLRRVAADFENYRKRTLRDQAATHLRAAEKIIVALMPVLDTFDAALNTEPSTDSERLLYSGMINTREQLLNALASEGLEVVPTIDEKFDPEIHEPAGAPSGQGELYVSQELRRGYKLNGKVLRAALVALEVKE